MVEGNVFLAWVECAKQKTAFQWKWETACVRQTRGRGRGQTEQGFGYESALFVGWVTTHQSISGLED